ncbi:hypothetical protein FOA52_014613, partial [Chlamydomonas sp. UWO 241]
GKGKGKGVVKVKAKAKAKAKGVVKEVAKTTGKAKAEGVVRAAAKVKAMVNALAGTSRALLAVDFFPYCRCTDYSCSSSPYGVDIKTTPTAFGTDVELTITKTSRTIMDTGGCFQTLTDMVHRIALDTRPECSSSWSNVRVNGQVGSPAPLFKPYPPGAELKIQFSPLSYSEFIGSTVTFSLSGVCPDLDTWTGFNGVAYSFAESNNNECCPICYKQVYNFNQPSIPPLAPAAGSPPPSPPTPKLTLSSPSPRHPFPPPPRPPTPSCRMSPTHITLLLLPPPPPPPPTSPTPPPPPPPNNTFPEAFFSPPPFPAPPPPFTTDFPWCECNRNAESGWYVQFMGYSAGARSDRTKVSFELRNSGTNVDPYEVGKMHFGVTEAAFRRVDNVMFAGSPRGAGWDLYPGPNYSFKITQFGGFPASSSPIPFSFDIQVSTLSEFFVANLVSIFEYPQFNLCPNTQLRGVY